MTETQVRLAFEAMLNIADMLEGAAAEEIAGAREYMVWNWGSQEELKLRVRTIERVVCKFYS